MTSLRTNRALKKAKTGRPEAKPYGFCCAESESSGPGYSRRPTALASLGSVHEGPALRLLTQEVEERRVATRRGSRLSFSGGGPGAGFPMSGSARSRRPPRSSAELELAAKEARRRRKEAYERDMDRWARLAERKLKRAEGKLVRCLAPCWYTEFSPGQLGQLGRLEDAMFKDKEQRTIDRTWDCLRAMGMVSETAKVGPTVLRGLIAAFSEDPMRFLCEVYRAITGNYFQAEGSRNDYLCHERIILSGIAFLELPRVIAELHRRLPPVEKWTFPPKPKQSLATLPKRMESPLLEKLRLPVNWRLYETRLLEWRKKCSEIIRPVAVLPKHVSINADDMMSIDEDVDRKAADDVNQRKSSVTRNKTHLAEKFDGNEETSAPKRESVNNKKSNDKETDVKNHLSARDITAQYDQDSVEKIELNQDRHVEGKTAPDERYPMKTDWTIPPSPCPYKYRRLLNEKGPLRTDEQFFSELKPRARKEFPAGRENLSLGMQRYLLDVEADLFQLCEAADNITGAVYGVVKEMQQAELSCDPCCACAQTKRQHEKWHATKWPHNVIDAVTLADHHEGQVIGAVALHSPASSLSSLGQLPCVPSREKIAKEKIIAGATMADDGQVVSLVDGVTKALDHVPREYLIPEVEDEIRNVPACECLRQEESEAEIDLQPSGGKYEGVCFGKKFRPREGPGYNCPEFAGKTGQDGDCGCEEESACLRDDSGEWEDDQLEDGWLGKCGACEDSESVEQTDERDVRKICKTCGKRLEVSCEEKFSKTEAAPGKSKLGQGITTKCSCDSLSEFLEMDLTKIECITDQKQYYRRKSQERKDSKTKIGSRTKQKAVRNTHPHISSKTIRKTRREKKEKKPVLINKKRKSSSSHEEKKEIMRKKDIPKKSAAANEQASLQEDPASPEIPEEGGPYGYRSKSEEALAPQRTIAYLTEAPSRPVEMITVREGGRACHCRENRNRRKTLLYNIGALSGQEPVLEGVHWLTPVPSLRRSDEYLPEYELYDSPYGRPRDTTAICDHKDENSLDEAESRSGDWENAFKDQYLTEFFTKKRGREPCGGACSKCKGNNTEPRKLKVMKPVCECKYERKIVKRNEERKEWTERQRRLKAMEKESCLHIVEVSKPAGGVPGDTEENQEVDAISAEIVIASVTMQTPCATPSSSRDCTNLFDAGNEARENALSPKYAESSPKNEALQGTHDDQKKSSPKKRKISIQSKINSSPKGRKLSGASTGQNDTDKSIVQKRSNVLDKNDNPESETKIEISHRKSSEHDRRRSSNFLNEMEENLKSQICQELKKMADENFITVKLPNYHEMPQISYWISYRVRGMHFTEKYKKKLMEESMKAWVTIERKIQPNLRADPFEISKEERPMLNFDRALYWKRKIAKKHLEFYTKLRHEVICFGRNAWRTMEYGKFPNVTFKGAYFTYLPSREKDAFVFRPV